jgi:ABC-type amino acid transport substrate-binding protein
MKLFASSREPIIIFENVFMFKRGENRLKKIIDGKLEELKKEGVIAKLIKKYTGSEDTFLS